MTSKPLEKKLQAVVVIAPIPSRRSLGIQNQKPEVVLLQIPTTG